jgi:hypothetical protein
MTRRAPSLGHKRPAQQTQREKRYTVIPGHSKSEFTVPPRESKGHQQVDPLGPVGSAFITTPSPSAA